MSADDLLQFLLSSGYFSVTTLTSSISDIITSADMIASARLPSLRVPGPPWPGQGWAGDVWCEWSEERELPGTGDSVLDGR